MTNLYQIDGAIQDLLSQADENGCIDEAAFDALSVEKSEKQHNIIRYILHLKNDQDVFKKELERVKKLKDMAEKREEWLKNYLARSMVIDGVDKLDFTLHKASFRLTPPRVVVENESTLPEKYIRTEIVKKVDKEAIKADLKAGDVVAGCRLEQDKKLHIS